jgi:hypothetical protein
MGSVSTTLPCVSEKLRERIAELSTLEELLYAQINQVIGMRLAFEECLGMDVKELTDGGGESPPSSDPA